MPRFQPTVRRLAALGLAFVLGACSDGRLPSGLQGSSRPPRELTAQKVASYDFQLLEACAGCVTGASGISNTGIVGAGANGQGYLYDSRKGTWTPVPGTFVMTVPADNGEVPGLTFGPGGLPAPVLRDRDGTVRQVDGYPSAPITAIIQLGNSGAGVGWTTLDFVHWFSFLRSRTGAYTKLEYPGPVVSLTLGTFLLGMTESGTMVGYLSDPTETQAAGVIRHKNGTWELFMIPGSSATMIYAITESGTMVGTYRDATGWHGFVWTRGSMQTVDVAGAPNTVVSGINNRGDLVVDTFTGASPLTGTGGPSYLATR